MSLRVSAVVCQNINRAIGHNNNLLFRLRKDMQHFKQLTAGPKAVLMGQTP